MNREESLALYAEGREAWNAWAEHLVNERRNLTKAGLWVEGLNRDEWNEATRIWQDTASVNFTAHDFDSDALFENFNFPVTVIFDDITFSENSYFGGTSFSGEVRFSKSLFMG